MKLMVHELAQQNEQYPSRVDQLFPRVGELSDECPIVLDVDYRLHLRQSLELTVFLVVVRTVHGLLRERRRRSSLPCSFLKR